MTPAYSKQLAWSDALYKAEGFARDCEKEGRIEDAIQWALHVVKRGKEERMMWFLAELYLRQNEFADARRWAQKASHAGDEPSHLLLADILFQQAAASEEAQAQLLLDPTQYAPEVMEHLAALYLKARDQESALQWYRKAAAGNGKSAKRKLADLLMEMADRSTKPEVKVQRYTEASECGCDDADYGLSLMWDKAGDSQKAEFYLFKAAETGNRRAKQKLVQKGLPLPETTGEALVHCSYCQKKVRVSQLLPHQNYSCPTSPQNTFPDGSDRSGLRYDNYSNRG